MIKLEILKKILAMSLALTSFIPVAGAVKDEQFLKPSEYEPRSKVNCRDLTIIDNYGNLCDLFLVSYLPINTNNDICYKKFENGKWYKYEKGNVSEVDEREVLYVSNHKNFVLMYKQRVN